MTEEPRRDSRQSSLDVLAERVAAAQGRLVTVRLSGQDSWELATRLDIALNNDRGRADVRLVLGSACTTAAKAVEQFVTAMQLGYEAARSWADFFDHLGERPSSARSCLVVANACDLLKHEDYDTWQELTQELTTGPHCLGGGWNTLVLADHQSMWQNWVFRSAAGDAYPNGPDLLTLAGRP